MVTHLEMPDGTLRELTQTERRKYNREVLGLSDARQREIEAIEAGESDGDVIDIPERKT